MRVLCVLALALGIAFPASAQAPDTILINGKIITLDSRSTVATGARGHGWTNRGGRLK